MITPALVILLMIVGWGAAAFAMLWGMLRIARYHYKSSTEAHRSRRIPTGKTVSDNNVSLSV